MNFAFTPEQDMLRDSVRRFLDAKVPSSRVRELMETESGSDPALWAEMAEMGWPAMAIPEEHGGAGFSILELGIVLEETGRSLTPSPLFATALLGAQLLLLGGSEAQKAEHLPLVAAGERTLAVAVVDDGGGWEPDDITTRARDDGEDVVLDGVKSYVVDGHTADVFLVAARHHGEPAFFVVPADAEGVARSRLETMDMTRKQARVELAGVRIPAEARLPGPPMSSGARAETLARWYELAVTGLAFEQVGGAARCLEMSVSYAKERVQFGRPIGSFQAVKHTCADMLVQVESARSAAYYAGWAASVGDDELRIVAPLAKSYCSDAYFKVAADTIQVHGGIGFTWEHDAHLYFKRAKSSQLMFGDTAAWRAELAGRLGL